VLFAAAAGPQQPIIHSPVEGAKEGSGGMKVAGVDVKDLPASYSSRATAALGVGDPSGGANSAANATQLGTNVVNTLKVRTAAPLESCYQHTGDVPDQQVVSSMYPYPLIGGVTTNDWGTCEG
jgi:hypothetical protein